MFRNYLKIAIRHLQRNKFITAINVTGLAVGMACCIFIVLYVRDELSFDKFHRNAGNIYRVTRFISRNGVTEYDAPTQIALAPAIRNEVKGLKEVTRVFIPGVLQIQVNDKKIKETKVKFVDPGYLKTFSFGVLSGKSADLLKAPYTAVLTQSAARKYFGNESPIGKSMLVSNSYNCLVTGVMQDMPQNTDIGTDVAISFSTFLSESLKAGIDYEQQWFNFLDNQTFIQVDENADLANVQRDLTAMAEHYTAGISRRLGVKFGLNLQPLSHIHQRPQGDFGKDNMPMLWIYLAIGAFIILIACFNFINLTTARAHERAREVGLRKVLGAEKKSLVLQFLTESSLISIISLIISLLLVIALLPAFNTIAAKNIKLGLSIDSVLLTGLVLLAAVVGLLAGSYPAFYLSSLLPIKVLKGKFATSHSGIFVRKALVVFQFAVAVAMIISSFVVYSQLKYWSNKNLGFDKEHLVNIRMDAVSPAVADHYKAKLLERADVKSASLNSMLLGNSIDSNNPIVEEGKDDKEGFVAGIIHGDFDLVKTLKLKIIAGRNFDPAMRTDSNNAFIVNEAAVRSFGFKDPIGQRIEWRPGSKGVHGTIIGVVADFNYQDLKKAVTPVLYMIKPEYSSNLTLRLAPGNHTAQLAELEELWNSLSPDLLFQYSFVDQDLQNLYKGESTLGRLFGIFSGLTILIACIGLLGLSILIAQQRTKEIGIRKVLGASAAHLSVLLTKDFLKLVLIGSVFALPVAYFGMNSWLQRFVFRVSVEWWIMVLAILMVVIIAIVTISLQAVKAALVNPVVSLKTE